MTVYIIWPEIYYQVTSNLQPQWPQCLSSLVSWNKLQTGDDHKFFSPFYLFFRLDRCGLKSHLFGRGCLNLAVPAEKREMKNDLCVYPFEILNKSPIFGSSLKVTISVQIYSKVDIFQVLILLIGLFTALQFWVWSRYLNNWKKELDLLLIHFHFAPTYTHGQKLFTKDLFTL